MAAGEPVIGVAEGGLRETILDRRTGTLLKPDFSVSDLVEAVTALTPAEALGMRRACEARAAQFSRTRFVDAMKAVLA